MIRTLGLYQPFAGLMLHGKIETRFVRAGRKAPFPLGTYMLYSTKRTYWINQLCEGHDPICTHAQVEGIKHWMEEDPDAFIEGHALLIADLKTIIDPVLEDTPDTWVKYQAPDVCYRRVGLVFENVKRIKPFPFKGKQGIGFLDEKYHVLLQP